MVEAGLTEKSDVKTVFKHHATGNIYRDIHGWQLALHDHEFGNSFIGRRLKTWKPWWCIFVLFVNFFYLVMTCAYDGVEDMGVNPMLGPTSKALLKMGAKNADLIFDCKDWWRIITCNWMHAGWVRARAPSHPTLP